MRYFSAFASLAISLIFGGCFFFDYSNDFVPRENIIAMRWSQDASSFYVCREQPYDSAGATRWKYFIEQYNPQGTLLASVSSTIGHAVLFRNESLGFAFFSPDCKHLITAYGSGISIAGFSDSVFHPFLSWPGLATMSPSSHLVLCDTDNGSGQDGRDITLALLWADSGNMRMMQKWHTHGVLGDQHNIVNDDMFSIAENVNGSDVFSLYDTSLKLLYREPLPPHGMQSIGYDSQNHKLIAIRNSGPNGKVVAIDLTNSQSQNVLDWMDVDINTAPDGFHVVYSYLATRVHNLYTGQEKDISSESPLHPLFSPDGQFVSYLTGPGSTTVRCAAVNGLP